MILALSLFLAGGNGEAGDDGWLGGAAGRGDVREGRGDG